MLLLDVNVVLAIHRGDHPDHETARGWFESSVREAGSRFTVPTVVWGSFLRLATNRRIFEVPSPREEAFDFIEAVRAQPNHLAVSERPRHLELLREICEQSEAAGDLIADAVIAAIAVENACEVVTYDRDFSRFESVAHTRPA